MGLLLAIDAGNTNVKFGLFDGPTLTQSWCGPTAGVLEQAESIIARVPRTVRDAAAACVVRDLRVALAAAVRHVLGRELRFLGEDLPVPIPVACDEPHKVGADRLANAIAAKEAFGCPVVAIDFGTAITLDVVGAEGEFLGGAIAPGVDSGVRGLFSAADLLEPMELKPPTQAIGRNTREALEAGVIMGAAALVDGLVRRVWTELGRKCPTVATGGAARQVVTFCEMVRDVDEFLTLRGIALALERALQ